MDLILVKIRVTGITNYIHSRFLGRHGDLESSSNLLFHYSEDSHGDYPSHVMNCKATQRKIIREALNLHVFGPFFDWVVYFSGTELQELLIYF